VSSYLLDTNVCVEYLRNRNPNVVQRLSQQPAAHVRLCSVVLAELYYGAFRSADPAKNLALLQKFAARFVSTPFDDAAAAICGQERVRLEKQGQRIGPHDLQIAAIALANGLTIVSRNVGEFSRVQGLLVEDWQV